MAGAASRTEWASMAWQCTGLFAVPLLFRPLDLFLVETIENRFHGSLSRMRPGSRGAAPLLPHLYTYRRFIVVDTLELGGPAAGLLGGLRLALLTLENET